MPEAKGLTLRELHRRLSNILETYEGTGLAYRADLPVMVRMARGKGNPWYLPVLCVDGAEQSLNDSLPGVRFMTVETNEQAAVKLGARRR